MKDNLKIIRNNEHYNPYVLDIILEISLKHFSCECELLDIIDINSFYCKALVRVNNFTLYIKYSKSENFIEKDYGVNWMLQDLDMTLKPINCGYLKLRKIFYTTLKHESLPSLKDNFKTTNEAIELTKNILTKFQSTEIQHNEKVPSLKSFLNLKFNFITVLPLINESDREDFNEIAAYYATIHEKMNYDFNNKTIEESKVKLIHGNLNEFNILLGSDSFMLEDFEHCLWGNPIIDLCIFCINLNINKKTFLEVAGGNEMTINEYSFYYDICLMKKSLDLIVNIIYCYIFPQNKHKSINATNTLKLNFFSKIEEINVMQNCLLNLINHSNV